jgi:23S rRNA pseudouridine955/2504/2580 synthase
MKQHAKEFASWILYRDEDFIVVNKPPFVPSLHERGKFTHISLLEMAREFHPDATLCHRLDRETSGAVVIALHAEAYRHMSIQFEDRKVEKIYHAVVEGQIQFDDHLVDLPIQTETPGRVRIDRSGKPSATFFKTLEIFRHFTLMECQPVTGRMHQIRVHLESQNTHILGDELYGGKMYLLSQLKRKHKGEDSPLMKRFALHATMIAFRKMNDEILGIEAPYPKDMEVLLKILRKYDAVS